MERTASYPDATGKSTVRLGIALRWCDVDSLSVDPMDEVDFDDEISFPSVKPNTDVFGLQRYNSRRKQRGWYQVRRWPLGLQEIGDEKSKYATGADVPQELFDEILAKYFG